MSDETTATAEATKTAKPKTEITKVKMNDGREVEFAGKRNMNKGYTVNGEGVTAVFDFRTGDTLSLTIKVDDPMLLKLAGHGLIQKGGDEAAGVKDTNGQPDVASMVLAVESVLTRLANTEASLDDRWFAEAAAGDGFSGASVVIRAIMEATGKDQDFVKKHLEKKLEADKAAGGSLTRQKLYAGFRRPGTKTAAIIERMEREKAASAAPNIDVDAELASMS